MMSKLGQGIKLKNLDIFENLRFRGSYRAKNRQKMTKNNNFTIFLCNFLNIYTRENSENQYTPRQNGSEVN